MRVLLSAVLMLAPRPAPRVAISSVARVVTLVVRLEIRVRSTTDRVD